MWPHAWFRLCWEIKHRALCVCGKCVTTEVTSLIWCLFLFFVLGLFWGPPPSSQTNHSCNLFFLLIASLSLAYFLPALLNLNYPNNLLPLGFSLFLFVYILLSLLLKGWLGGWPWPLTSLSPCSLVLSFSFPDISV